MIPLINAGESLCSSLSLLESSYDKEDKIAMNFHAQLIDIQSSVSKLATRTLSSESVLERTKALQAKTTTLTQSVVTVGEYGIRGPLVKNILDKIKDIQDCSSILLKEANDAVSRGEPLKYFDTYEPWKKEYNYIKSFIARHPTLDPKIREELTFYMLQYLVNIADVSHEDAEKFQRYTSPLGSARGDYFRHQYGPIGNVIVNKILAKLKWPKEIILINNRKFKRELRNKIHYINARNPKAFLQMDHIQHLPTPKGETPKPIFVRIHVDYTEDPEAMQAQIKKGIADFESHFKEEDLAKLKERLKYGCFTSVGGQEILLFPRLIGRTTSTMINELSKYAGYTLTLQGGCRALSRLMGVEEIPSEFNLSPSAIPPLEDTKELASAPTSVTNLKEFFGDQAYVAFKQKAGKTSRQEFQASFLCSLLEGLAKRDLEGRFKSKGVSDLLYETLDALLLSMKEANESLAKGHDFEQQFDNSCDQIFEKLRLLAGIGQFYTKEEVEAILQAQMHGLSGHRPDLVRITSSGMRAAAETTHIIAKQQEGNQTGLVVMNGRYYEDVGRIEALAKGVSLRVVYKIDPSNLEESLKKLAADPSSIHGLCADIHPSFSLDTYIYEVQDLTKTIKTLLSAGVAAKPLTVSIDTTVGFINSEEMRKMLNDLAEEINTGKLNIVVHWTAQKFDQGGFDKLSAGSILVYSRDKKFLDLFQGLKRSEDLDDSNIQGLGVIYEHGLKHIEEYRRRIFENAERLYSQIDDRLKYTEQDLKMRRQEKPFLVSCKRDKQTFFIDVNINDYMDYPKVFKRLLDERYPVMKRNSFGYRQETLMIIGGIKNTQKIRFSLGLDDTRKLARTLNHIGTALNSAATLLNDSPLVKSLFKKEYERHLIIGDEAFRNKFIDVLIKKLEEGEDVNAGNLDLLVKTFYNCIPEGKLNLLHDPKTLPPLASASSSDI